MGKNWSKYCTLCLERPEKEGGERKVYSGTAGAPIIGLGNKFNESEVNSEDDNQNDMSCLTGMSRSELITMMCKHNVSTTKKGPRPNFDVKLQSIDSEDESNCSSSSSWSDFSSSEEEVENQGTATEG